MKGFRLRASGFGLLFAGAALLAGATPVLGQDGGARPFLQGVEPGEVRAGGVITIAGTNFSEDVDTVEVKVGSETGIVIGARADSLKVMLPPELKKGTYPISVKVGGRTATNEVSVKVIGAQELSQEEEDARRKEDLGKYEGPSATGKEPEKPITLLPPKAVQQQGRWRIECVGTARLPDGCIVNLHLSLGERVFVDHRDATMQGGGFTCVFGPYDRELFPGHYFVKAAFDLDTQPMPVKRRFEQELKDPKEKNALRKIWDRQAVLVGTTVKEQEEVAALKAHFRNALEGAKELHHELELAYGATGKTIFKAEGGKSYNDGEWRDWLKKHSLKGMSEEAREKELKALDREKRFFQDGYHFSEVAWREWLDANWRNRVQALARKHNDLERRYVQLKWPDSSLDLKALFGALLKLSMVRSEDMYDRNGLKPHAFDVEPEFGDIVKLPGTVRIGYFEKLAKKIIDEVGIEELKQKPKG